MLAATMQETLHRLDNLTSFYLRNSANFATEFEKSLQAQVKIDNLLVNDAQMFERVPSTRIEHLFPDDLEGLPYNIFGIIQPEIAIFTTPNSEYNILFPNFSGFRHDDHKFEWTREQFESWANNLVLRYPHYKVVFGGVGQGPDGRQDCGFCTQIAVFFRNNLVKNDTSLQFSEFYEEIRKVEYPFTTESERLLHALQYETEKFIFHHSKLDCYKADEQIEIPLKDLQKFLPPECSCTDENLREILESCGYKINIRKDGTSLIIIPAFEDDDLDDFYKSSSSLEDHDQYYLSEQQAEEDWDLDSTGTMDLTNNSIEKVTNADNEPSLEKIAHMESKPLTRAYSRQQVCQSEEAHSSAGPDESNKSSSRQFFEHSMSCSTGIQNENSVENCVHLIRSPLQKCHSLENVNRDSSKNNPCRFSLNIDKYKYIDCDIGTSESNDIQKVASALSALDTFGPRQEDSFSQSKAADSGYPNSCGQDMDMDLTPEQVDEIITESESSFDGDVEDESGGEEDEPVEIRGDVVRLGENVENGDVANNNRDGEGNNMEAVAGNGVLQFEQVIAEEEVVVGNLAALVVPDSDEDLAFLSVGDLIMAPGCEEEPELLSSNGAEGSDLNAEVTYAVFPDWLLRIQVGDDDGAGEGDVGQHAGENANDYDTSSLGSDIEQVNRSEVIEESSIELIVQGDLKGGGEQLPNN